LASRTVWAGVVVVIIAIIIIGLVYYELNMSGGGTSGLTPNITYDIYGGEIGSSQYGFGVNSTTLASPGATLTFKVGDVVKVTFHNEGQVPHGWEITNQNTTGGTVLFGASIGLTSYISPGNNAQVTFNVTQAGNYYYICTVPGHAQLGMWGQVVVTAS